MSGVVYCRYVSCEAMKALSTDDVLLSILWRSGFYPHVWRKVYHFEYACTSSVWEQFLMGSAMMAFTS